MTNEQTKLSTAELEVVQQAKDSMDRSPVKIERYNQITRNLTLTDRNSILNYGNELNSIMEQNSHKMLSVARASDSGEMAKLTHELRNKLEVLNPTELVDTPWKSFLRTLHILPSVTSLTNKYTTVESDLDSIKKQLEKVAVESMQDNTEVELHKENLLQYIQQTSELIEAAIYKSEELKNQLYDMQEHSDQYEAYEMAQVSNFVDALDRKIYALTQTRLSFKLTISELEIAQNTNSLTAEWAQNFVHDVIPNWRTQLSTAIIIEKGKKRLEALQMAKKVNEDLLINNAKMLKANAEMAAKNAKNGVFDPKALEQATQTIISTLDNLDKIQDEAAIQMQENTKRILECENRMADAQKRIASLNDTTDYLSGNNSRTLKELK